MDQPDFEFLLSHLEAQEKRLRLFLDRRQKQARGSTFIRLVRLHISGAGNLRAQLAVQYAAAADPTARGAIERKVLRLREALDDLHIWAVHFAADVGRTDIPVGLMYLVDAMLGVVMTEPRDALFHTDDNYMYSVISPVQPLSELFDTKVVAWAETTQPVILNLPGADPTNMFLAPILAHEVGHPAVVEQGLLNQFDHTVDKSAIQPVWDDCVKMGVSDSALREVFSKWITELICDAFAVAIAGPSMLFASLAFLPGPIAGRFGESHPDAAHRIALTIRWLEELGWDEWLADRLPEVDAWARGLAGQTADPKVPAVLRRLSDAVPYCGDAIWSIVSTIVGLHRFEPVQYVPFEHEASALLSHRIPPVEIGSGSLQPWVIVLATWVHALSMRGANPAVVAHCVDDRPQSEAALKAIELASVLRLWRQDAPAAT